MSLIRNYKWMPTTFQDVSVFGFHSSPSFITLDRQTFRSLFHFAKKNNKKDFSPFENLVFAYFILPPRVYVSSFLYYFFRIFVFWAFGEKEEQVYCISMISRRQRERDR